MAKNNKHKIVKVKMLASQAGVDFSRDCGKVYDVDASEGKRLVINGLAEYLSGKEN